MELEVELSFFYHKGHKELFTVDCDFSKITEYML